MRVKIRYASNRLDVFDTDTFTKPEPFSGTSMLTNFELRFDSLGDCGLWLEAHHYDVSPSYGEQTDSRETPVARRKRGWRFLLAEAGEMNKIETVLVDEVCVLQRVCGELVDVLKLDEQCQAWVTGSQSLCVSDKLIELYQALVIASETSDVDAIARSCGCSYGLIKAIHAMQPTETKTQEQDRVSEEENWMEGFDYEDTD